MSEEIVSHKFIRALPHQLAPVIAARAEMLLAELGKLSDDPVPLVVNNASALQFSSKEKSAK